MIVATHLTQGQRSGDFAWVNGGEFVHIYGLVCDRDQDPDGPCGCRRAFTGLPSRKAITTAIVADVDIDEPIYLRAVRDSEIAAWGMQKQEDELRAPAIVAGMIKLANEFSVGTTLERRGDVVQRRAANI